MPLFSQASSRFRFSLTTLSIAALSFSLSAFATTEWPAQWIAAQDVPLNAPRGAHYIPAVNPPGRFVSQTDTGLGYHALIASSADTVKWVQVDLGSAQSLETLRLQPLNHEGVPGFGFPLRYRVELANDANFSEPVLLADHTAADVPNPGDTVVEIDAQGKSARFIRITATRVFSRPSIPSEFCFALRSLEAISGGENIALNAAVTALDSVEAHGWSTVHLTNGSSPPVTPRREAVMMRRDVTLAQKPTRAIARVAGMGFVDFMINGQKAGDRVMAPSLTDFTKRAYFDTYDVTDHLRAGTNTLAALLGNGLFASPGRGWNSWYGVGNEPVASIDLEITLPDGSTQHLGTDASWKWSTGEITHNDFCSGETHDLRLAQPGWKEAGFIDTQWQPVAVVAPPPGKLLPNTGPAVRVTYEVKPIRVEGNKYIFEFMHTGWPSIRVHGEAGQIVRIKGSADYEFTLKGGGEEILEPRFVIQTIGPELIIEGIDPPPLDAVTIKSAHADLRRTGDFSCSDPFLNEVYQAFIRTHENYTFDYPWDPTREKSGWTQDVQTMFDSAAFSTDMQPVYTRWWRDFVDGQQPDGALGSVVPLPWGGQEHIWNDPWWSGMIIYTPWKLYQFYGDSDLLAEAYEPMRAYFTWLSNKAEPDGILRWSGASDWIEVGIDGWGPPIRTPTFLVSTCAWYLYADILRQTATILGKPDEAAQYAQIAGQIRDTFNAQYFDPTTGFYANATDSQTSLILPLAFGMVPHAQRPLVTQRLAENIQKWGGLNTGFVGTPYLLKNLADLGLAELSHMICTRRDYAGWNTLIKHGVMMETWNGGMVQMPSLGGSIGQWFFRTLGGIRHAAPGFKEILIKPSIIGDLTHVNTWHDCPHGRIISNWKRSGDTLEMAVTIPAGTTATVQFPQAKTTITKSGPGILQLAATPIHTGITTVAEGVLQLGNGINPVGLAETNELVVAQGAILDLNYAGPKTIGGLTYNETPLSPGTYNAITTPEFITGTGTLTVTDGASAQTLLLTDSFDTGVNHLAETFNTAIALSQGGTLATISYTVTGSGWRNQHGDSVLTLSNAPAFYGGADVGNVSLNHDFAVQANAANQPLQINFNILDVTGSDQNSWVQFNVGETRNLNHNSGAVGLGMLFRVNQGTQTFTGGNDINSSATYFDGDLVTITLSGTGGVGSAFSNLGSEATVKIGASVVGTFPLAQQTHAYLTFGGFHPNDIQSIGTFDNLKVSLISAADPDYVTWANSFDPPIGGPAADDDNDGLSNFEEYAFGLIPNSGASVNPIAVPLDRTTGTFSYTRRTRRNPPLTYTVWVSTDLMPGNWTQDTGAVEGTPTLSGEVETVPVTITPALLDNLKLFIQVRAD